jgi:hypothetical protein
MNPPRPSARLFLRRADFSEATAKIAGPGWGRRVGRGGAGLAKFLIRCQLKANEGPEIVGTAVAFCGDG